jgi:hypothetical protein
MDALSYFFKLPLYQQLLWDLLFPLLLVLFFWWNDSLEASLRFLLNKPNLKYSPKYFCFLLAPAYLFMISLTIYSHVHRHGGQ